MGRKINPKLYRLHTNQDWESHWFAPRGRFGSGLKMDYTIREMVFELFQKGIIDKVRIERSLSNLKVIISTPRPGLVVGKQGVQIKQIEAKVNNFFANEPKPPRVLIEIQEIKNPELHAHLIAQEIASQLERRMSYRRVLKQTLARLMRHKNVKGAKIRAKGRLGGAEIARLEQVFAGSVPLQTLRSDIEYGFSEAITKWGAVGVKVWIYKGEIFQSLHEETNGLQLTTNDRGVVGRRS